ncbi:hypothetical protein N9Z27_02620 [Alphaproteobacteria bacterium]|nr:hypothetical protein [Alphaproteobacteria bacterium]
MTYLKRTILATLITFMPISAHASCRGIPAPPTEYAGMALEGVKDYGTEELGVAVKYVGDGEKLTFYRFDAGLGESSDALFQETVEGVYDFLAPQGYTIDSARDLEVAVKTEGKPTIERTAMIVAEKQGTKELHFVATGRDNSCALKLRYTAVNQDYSEETHTKFLSLVSFPTVYLGR